MCVVSTTSASSPQRCAVRHRFGVDPICTVLREHGIKIAPSTYYAAKKRGKVSAVGARRGVTASTVHRFYLAFSGGS